ncbi:hypothetical protein ABIE62_002789 [Porphyrobacter sp. MBR-155]
MCSYLDQVGSTYYFRRTVPKDLVGTFLTNSRRARTEWKHIGCSGGMRQAYLNSKRCTSGSD